MYELQSLMVIKVHMDNESMDNICCNMESSDCKSKGCSGYKDKDKDMDKDNQGMNDKVRPPQQLL